MALGVSHCVTAVCCMALSLDLALPCILSTQLRALNRAGHQGTFVELSQCPEPPSLLRYWKLDPAQVYASSPNAWDTAVHDASEEYKHRMVGELHLQGTRVRTSVGGSPTAQPDPTLLASPAQPLL